MNQLITQRPAVLFADALSQWFDRHGRAFPWRQSDNPFLVLVAELLLRKTQAQRVQAVYSDFCMRFSAPEQVLATDRKVLSSMLDVLGLAKRTDWLLDLCAQLVANHEGTVPSSYRALLKLKGVGPYTANMVLCVCFGKRTIPVDNNVARLVSRVFGVPRSGDTRREKAVETILSQLPEHTEPKVLAFGMLDFAAAVCKSVKPRCSVCPLSMRCKYRGVTEASRSRGDAVVAGQLES